MPLWILACSVLTGILAWLVVPAIARRASKQPVGLDLEAEQLLLASVWADPRRLPYLSDISADMFASGVHQRLWQAMLEAAGERVVEISTDEEAAEAGARLAEESTSWKQRVISHLDNSDLRCLEALPVLSPDGHALESQEADEVSVAAGQSVVALHNDRTVMNGSALVVPSDTPDSTDSQRPPVMRIMAHISVARRIVVTACALAWTLSMAWLLQMTAYSGASYWLAAASWLMLGGAMLVVALVDHDTMYIDMPAWLVGTVGAWLLALAAAWMDESLDRALLGGAVVLATGLMFEIVNWVYKKVRGRDGQGFGDTLIIVATVGIPIALTGQAALGYYSVMGALLAALAGWCVARILGRAGKDIPFAFGPWLAIGPVVALAVVHLLPV